MKLKKWTLRGLMIAIAIVVGSAAGMAVTAAASAGDRQDVKYPVNGGGETYGSALDAHTPADEPDLITAAATNGNVGYIRGDDLVLPATTPEDNIRNNEIYLAGFTIPVHQSDGKTVIGEFQVGGPDSGSSIEYPEGVEPHPGQ